MLLNEKSYAESQRSACVQSSLSTHSYLVTTVNHTVTFRMMYVALVCLEQRRQPPSVGRWRGSNLIT